MATHDILEQLILAATSRQIGPHSSATPEQWHAICRFYFWAHPI